MAIKTKPQAIQEAPSAVASMNPDNMLAGGLMDDFDGTCIKARLVPWDYDGNLDHHILAVCLTIQPDEGQGSAFPQHYSTGDLESFIPSMDGKTGVDLASEKATAEDLEGVYALRVGKKEQLNNNTNWAQFLGAAIDAKLDKSRITPAVTFMEGIHGHWNRIPQKKRSGIITEPAQGQGTRRRSNDLLVLTEITPAPIGVGKTTARTVGAKAAGESGIDDALREVIRKAMAAGEPIGKAKLPSMAIQAFMGADKAKAVKRVSEAEFLDSLAATEIAVYDADSATLLPL